MLISKKAQQISVSQTLAISAMAKQLKDEGKSIIAFTAGEPDCHTPEYINDAAKAALDAGKTKYTPSSGTVELRKAIAKKLHDDNGLDYDFKQIVVSNGAKHSLYNALYAIIDDGDEVIIPAPYWLTYPELVTMCGGKSVIIETKAEDNFKITAEELREAITPKTKAFILNSPSNPTGALYSKEEIYELAKVIEETDIIVISDEIYEKLVYVDEPVTSIASYSEKLQEQTIVINGFSKSYAMTGWRLGYLAASKEIASTIDRVQSHMTSNANSMSQEAAVVALSRTDDVENLVKVYKERREVLVEKINEIDGLSVALPDGAFYLFVDSRPLMGKTIDGEEITGSIDLCGKLLKYGVSCIPGAPFGAEGFIRLSFAVSMDDIIEGTKRMANFVQSCK